MGHIASLIFLRVIWRGLFDTDFRKHSKKTSQLLPFLTLSQRSPKSSCPADISGLVVLIGEFVPLLRGSRESNAIISGLPSAYEVSH